MRYWNFSAGMLLVALITGCVQMAQASGSEPTAPQARFKLRFCEDTGVRICNKDMCKGENLNKDEDCRVPYASEPYEWLTRDSRVLNSGVTDNNGYADISRVPGVTDYAFETISIRWDIKAEGKCWAETPFLFASCAKIVSRTIRDDDDQGFDDPASLAERKKEKDAEQQKEQQRQQVEQERMQGRLAQYRKAALANDDELAWLGPLPPEWSEDELNDRMNAVYTQIRNGITPPLKGFDLEQAVLSFECKPPSAFGPTPDASAVTTYLKSLRDDVSEEEQTRAWKGLLEAGRQGNWQARLFIYWKLESIIWQAHPEDNPVLFWRYLQLLEWMAAHHAAILEKEAADAVPCLDGRCIYKGNYTTPFYVLAAVDGDYSSMAKAAENLDTDGNVLNTPKTDPKYQESLAQLKKWQAAVKRMGECPQQMMPDLPVNQDDM